MLLATVLLASAGLILSPRPLEMHAVAAAPRALAPAMAHHVNDKGAKKHNSCRPRKSRPSDRNRTPPSYPPLPEPTGPVLIGSSEGRIETVTISVSPGDDAAALKALAAPPLLPLRLVLRSRQPDRPLRGGSPSTRHLPLAARACRPS